MPKKSEKKDEVSVLREKNYRLRTALMHLLIKLGLHANADVLSDEYFIEQAERYDPRRDDYYGRYRGDGDEGDKNFPREEDIPF